MKALRYLLNTVAVAHPDYALLRYVRKKRAGSVGSDLRLSVFTRKHIFRGYYSASELFGYYLTAVADAENGNSHLENFRIRVRGAVLVNAVRSARENDSYRVEFPYLFDRGIEGPHFTVYPVFTHSSRYKPVVLASEVQDNDLLHYSSPASIEAFISPRNSGCALLGRLLNSGWN